MPGRRHSRFPRHTELCAFVCPPLYKYLRTAYRNVKQFKTTDNILVPHITHVPLPYPWVSLTCRLSLLSLRTGCHDKAVLLYEYVGKRIVDLQHTEVPDAYRGRGIAKHLAKAALDFVVEEDLKAHLTCWYIQKYVKENPLPQYLERLQS
ncbi:Protein NATD1 [Varanus komodoensis]|nr:Protein NATD1 [Varanus komodoensis]